MMYRFLCLCLITGIYVPVHAEFYFGGYEYALEHHYMYLNEIQIKNHQNEKQSISYRTDLTVSVKPIHWNKKFVWLQIQLANVKTYIKKADDTTYKRRPSEFDDINLNPFYFEWHDGEIQPDIYIGSDEDESLVNFKRSIVSLFQYNIKDGERIETDVSGECTAGYELKSIDKYWINKTRTNCRSIPTAGVHSRIDNALNVVENVTRYTAMKVHPDMYFIKLLGKDRITVKTPIYNNAGMEITSTVVMNELQEKKVDPINEENLNRFLLKRNKRTIQFSQTVSDKVDMKPLFKKYKDALSSDQIGKSDAAIAIIKLVLAGRKASKDDLSVLFKSKKSKEVKMQLIDLLGAIQTKASHDLAKEIINFKSIDEFDTIERYLQSLSVGVLPSDIILSDLLAMLKENYENEKVKDTLIQTVAAVTRRYAINAKDNYADVMVKEVTSYLLNSLGECENEICSDQYIRAFKNLQSIETIPTLIKIALHQPKYLSVSAMKALRAFPITDIKHLKTIQKSLEQIFYQTIKKIDSSSRTLALDILLDLEPSYDELKQFVKHLKSNDRAYEVKQYLYQKLKLFADTNPELRKDLNKIIKTDPHLNNYHVLAQKGLTTALAREFSNYPSFNGSLLSIQEIHQGILKRGVVDLTIDTDHSKFSLFTLGLYAGGLSSFMSSSSSEDEPVEDEGPATAGMELAIQGSYLRPLEFFNGHGELMGHVWSGTGSEPTPAYTATTLLQDYKQVMHLNNGMQVDINVLGAISLNLNGQIQLSLWNRNAHCQVDQDAGIALYGDIKLKSAFVDISTEFEIVQEPKLQLFADIDFAGDIKLCMQLSQPNYTLRHSSLSKLTLLNTPYSVDIKMQRVFSLSGHTHALNQKNNEMCSTIFA